MLRLHATPGSSRGDSEFDLCAAMRFFPYLIRIAFVLGLTVGFLISHAVVR
jgi:hypothetical protein